MKRALIVCLFWATSLNAGYCATTMFPPLQPLQPLKPVQAAQPVGESGYYEDEETPCTADPYVTSPFQAPQNKYMASSGTSYPKISEIERSLYGNNFTAQDILLRLARIEKSLFSTSYPKLTLAQRVDNIIMNFNQINALPNISKNSLSGMEAKILRKKYEQNTDENRIERLEEQIFGAVQSGELSSRFETLKTASKNYNQNQNLSQYAPAYNQNPVANGQRGWKGIVGNLGSMLMGGGMMTGFTPSIDPFNTSNSAYNNNGNNYNSNGGNGGNGLYSNGYNGGMNNFASMGSPNGYGQYNGYRSNRGYSDSFNNYGAGSRVTILD